MTDAEAEASILWLPDVKSQFIGKEPDATKDWGQEKEVATLCEEQLIGKDPDTGKDWWQEKEVTGDEKIG